jgi:thioesterase domain-containing protein
MGDADNIGALPATLYHGHGARPPVLFVLTWHLGNHPLRDLAANLGDDQPAWCLDRDADPAGVAVPNVDGWVDGFMAMIDRLGIEAPYRLAGWSFGGLVALELARRLASAGREVSWIGLIDTRIPEPAPALIPFLAHEVEVAYREVAGRRARLGHVAFHARRFGRSQLARLRRRGRRRYASWRGTLSEDDASTLAFHAQVMPAWQSYRPRPIRLPVELFTTAEYRQVCDGDGSLGWSPYLWAGYRTHLIPGRHLTLFKQPHLATLVDMVRRSADAASQAPASIRSSPA